MRSMVFATMVLAVGVSDIAVAASESASSERGRALYEHWCAPCHGASAHAPGTMALAFKYNGEKPPVLIQRRDIDADALRYFIRNGVSVMPFFRKTELSDTDVAAIDAYFRAERK